MAYSVFSSLKDLEWALKSLKIIATGTMTLLRGGNVPQYAYVNTGPLVSITRVSEIKPDILNKYFKAVRTNVFTTPWYKGITGTVQPRHRSSAMYKAGQAAGFNRVDHQTFIAKIKHEISIMSQLVAQKKAEIARQLRIQQAAAAARAREAQAAQAAAEIQVRQAKIAAVQKKQLEDIALARAREAEARAREEVRSKEIAEARAREAKVLEDIAAARKREAEQAKEIAAARIREANKAASLAEKKIILAGKTSTLARGAAADASSSIVEAKVAKAVEGKQIQTVLFQEAMEDKLKAEKSVIRVNKMVGQIAALVKEATEASVVSKQQLLYVLDEISKYDALAVSEYGKAVFEENRTGWMEALKVKANALALPDQLEVVEAAAPKSKIGILPILIAGGAAYYYTSM